MKSDCTTCYYFTSFYDLFFGDKFEPFDYGVCENHKSPLYWNEGAGEGKICDYYKQINSNETNQTE